jgi:hypothetical protein
LRTIAAICGSEAEVAVRSVDRFALRQPLQNAELHLLLFGSARALFLFWLVILSELFVQRRASRRTCGCFSPGCPILWARFAQRVGTFVIRITLSHRGQRIPPRIGNAVIDSALHLGHQRKHSAQHLAQRCEIVSCNPLGQLKQLVAYDRLIVEHRFKIARLEISLGLHVERDHHADQLFFVEGNDDASTTQRSLALPDRISERAIERHRQRDFAISGHGRQNSV